MIPLWDKAVEDRIRNEACSLDEQTAPTEVKFCKKCVVSNQRPRIIFDDEGVCSACRYAERKHNQTDWKDRERQLAELLDKHRKSTGYDCIVPCSGGKDSAMVAHKLKHEYGMNPLCVKWAPFTYTDIGWKNFQSFIHSGFDCLTAFPNGLMHRKLSRLALEYLGDAWQPFAYGQLNYAMHISKKFDIPLVFFGENGEAEYGGDPRADEKPCWDTDDWDDVYLKGASVDKLINVGLELGAFFEDEQREISDFYRLPRELGKTEFHWFGYYQKWHPQSNYYYATENTGFESNPDGRSEGTYSKYASLDDRFDGFHFYLAYMKFGIGRCTSDAAHEIRDGDITREEAVALVRKYDGEFPAKHFKEFLEYLGIDEEHFQRVCDKFRHNNIWSLKNCETGVPKIGNWNLMNKVWNA